MKNYTKLTFKIFWEHSKKYNLVLVLIILSIITANVINVITPFYYKKFFDILIVNGTKAELVNILFTILILYSFEWVFWRLSGFINSYYQTTVMRDLAVTCFAYLHKHSVVFFNNSFVGFNRVQLCISR